MGQQSRFFAERLEREAGTGLEDQVRRGFDLAFGRTPTSEETASSAAFVKQDGLPQFCRALFNANEFIFVY
jgi:hypothetical protein